MNHGDSRDTTVPGAPSDIRPLGLALSGGGFRAALFHLGVLQFLSENHILENIKIVSSVSGGSILAAHLVLNWAKYVDSEASFREIATKIIEFAQFDIRSRIIRRSLASFVAFLLWVVRQILGISMRTQQLEKSYRLLFGRSRLCALASPPMGSCEPRRPSIHILASSLRTGEACAFSARGFRVANSDPECRWLGADSVMIAKAVAASSAFPIIFPPVRINARTLRCKSGELPNDEFLTDGGVIDNSGRSELLQMAKNQTNDGILLLSDASQNFNANIRRRWWPVFYRGPRAVSMLMERIRELRSGHRNDEHAAPAFRNTIVIDIRRIVPREGREWILDAGVQRMVSKIRTDLDRFKNSEVQALITHGYEVAWSTWNDAVGKAPPPRDQWKPVGIDPSKLTANELQDVKPDLLDSILTVLIAFDWTSGVLISFVIGWLCLVVFLACLLLEAIS
jgi:predicted acylesterase/phospholipase RssA